VSTLNVVRQLQRRHLVTILVTRKQTLESLLPEQLTSNTSSTQLVESGSDGFSLNTSYFIFNYVCIEQFQVQFNFKFQLTTFVIFFCISLNLSLTNNYALVH